MNTMISIGTIRLPQLHHKINLVAIRHNDIDFLWRLLLQRSKHPCENISHTKMPTWMDHVRFVLSNPYTGWYAIWSSERKLGVCYLTKNNEIGITIQEKYQGLGLSKEAILLLMYTHPVEYWLANINDKNIRSQSLFCSLGFNLVDVQKLDNCVQNTYRLTRDTWIDCGIYEWCLKNLER